ncbi:MAG: MerR family transcriptional regulator [Alphaproteobacteria bacterium]
MASERLASNSKKPTGRTRRSSNVKGTQKSAGAFRTISEVSTALDVPQHVLRFWETKFSQVRPMKRAGGRRYYRPEDVRLLFGIREFLYEDGYTIRGVQKLLRERGGRVLSERADGKVLAPVTSGDVQVDLENKKRTRFSLPEESQRRALRDLLHELEELNGILQKQLGML